MLLLLLCMITISQSLFYRYISNGINANQIVKTESDKLILGVWSHDKRETNQTLVVLLVRICDERQQTQKS